MPQYQQKLAASGYSTAQTLQFAYGCFQQLGWTVEYVTENRLIGYTKKTWKSYADHIVVDIDNELLTITSKLPESASFDLLGKNKRNVNKFISCFETIKASANDASSQIWQTEIEALQKHTEEAMVQQAKDAAEVDAVMNLSTGSRIVTYIIIGINAIVFLLMLFNGVSVFEPTVADIVKWGGNFRPYTTGGEWWRLLTSVFVHIGIIHIALNMYALYYVGMYLEPMLGKLRYTVAYLCTGVLASIASIWWSKDAVAAGASGAIFGLYGVFFALLTTKLIPAKVRSSLLSSIGIFIAYNLFYGASKNGIDNAAHIGGLLTGFVFGYIYFLSIRSEKFRPALASILVAAITLVFLTAYIKQTGSDELSYQQKLEKFGKIEEEALQPLRNLNVDTSTLSYGLTHISQDKWQEAKKLMDETNSYHLNPVETRQRNLLKEYIDLRIQETDLFILSLQQNHVEDVEKDFKEVEQKIMDKLEELKKNQK
jgi:rhomboid protease GluP